MPPGFTGWPPYTFTPRLWPLESRPFLVLPPPFLWAASMVAGTSGLQAQGRAQGTAVPQKPACPRAVSMSAACVCVGAWLAKERSRPVLGLCTPRAVFVTR